MRTLTSFVFALLACGITFAENPDISVNIGDPAPEFEAQDDTGQVWKSADHIGQGIVVLYFYPADMTSGCTKQACEFRDLHQELTDLGATVVGVSGDSVRNHQLFKKVHSLNFPLLADEDGKVARSFGVPIREGGEISRPVDGVEEKLIRGITASRWTFVIGPDGRVVHKNTKVNPAEDSQSVLKTVRQLTGNVE